MQGLIRQTGVTCCFWHDAHDGLPKQGKRSYAHGAKEQTAHPTCLVAVVTQLELASSRIATSEAIPVFKA